jgi:hypothetical protein
MNRPDLYIYLSIDNTNPVIVNLGNLKGKIGNQKHLLPPCTDLSKYNNVLYMVQAIFSSFR